MPDRRLASWIIPFGAGAVLGLRAVFSPEGLPGLSLCWFKAVTGRPCPGCGLTHAFCAISHGRFADAWSCNPFGFLFYALALGLLAWPFLLRVRPELAGRLARPQLLAWAIPGLVAAMWVFGLWRALRG